MAVVVTAPSRAAPPPSRERRSRLWAALAAPGIIWLAAFFISPLYVVLCIVFGQVDPIFRTPVPVWNPLQWDATQFTYVLTHIVGTNGVFGPAILRTFLFVFVASCLCLLVAFPVAYYVARLSGKRKGLLLALLMLAVSAVTFLLGLHRLRSGEPVTSMAGRTDWSDEFFFSAVTFVLGAALLAVALGWKPGGSNTQPPR